MYIYRKNLVKLKIFKTHRVGLEHRPAAQETDAIYPLVGKKKIQYIDLNMINKNPVPVHGRKWCTQCTATFQCTKNGKTST